MEEITKIYGNKRGEIRTATDKCVLSPRRHDIIVAISVYE